MNTSMILSIVAICLIFFGPFLYRELKRKNGGKYKIKYYL